MIKVPIYEMRVEVSRPGLGGGEREREELDGMANMPYLISLQCSRSCLSTEVQPKLTFFSTLQVPWCPVPSQTLYCSMLVVGICTGTRLVAIRFIDSITDPPYPLGPKDQLTVGTSSSSFACTEYGLFEVTFTTQR